MGYKTYKFKLYENKRRNAFLHARIQAFANPYNHFVALRLRYYRMYKNTKSHRPKMICLSILPN